MTQTFLPFLILGVKLVNFPDAHINVILRQKFKIFGGGDNPDPK